MTVTKRLRYEVLRRDGHRCVYCGATAKDAKLTIDHVIAVALGGTDDVGNLVTACSDCNGGKSSVTADEAFVAKVDEDTTRWQRAIAAAVRLRRDASTARSADLTKLEVEWGVWTYKRNEQPVPKPQDWRTTAEGFLVAGLPIEEMTRLVPVAMEARTRTELEYSEWRYFIGCCKRVLAEIEKTARELLDAKDSGVAVVVDDEPPIPDACVECNENPATEPGGICHRCDVEMAEWRARYEEERARLHQDPATVEPSLKDLP
jgi:hypothetical protein